MNDETRLIEVTTELMDTFGGRTLDGRRLSYEWGEPTGHEPDSDRWVYTPTVTATDDGMAVVERRTYEQRVEQMADAIHETCRLEWQAEVAVNPRIRYVEQHLANVHYGQAHDLVRRIFPELDEALP